MRDLINSIYPFNIIGTEDPKFAEWKSKRSRSVELSDLKVSLRPFSAHRLAKRLEANGNFPDNESIQAHIDSASEALKDTDTIKLSEANAEAITAITQIRRWLEQVLPGALVSPSWLKDALDYLSDKEIIDLFASCIQEDDVVEAAEG